MSGERRWPWKEALAVAEQVAAMLWGGCVRAVGSDGGWPYIEIAGSLRRRKPDVGDIEIVFVPSTVPVSRPAVDQVKQPELYMGEMLAEPRPATDRLLQELLERGWLEKRLNVNGGTAWGEHIKLARHVASGIPVDLFATNSASWFNYLVCRTGPKESNLAIAKAAQARGWKWEPYSPGFVSLSDGERHDVKSEQEVFEFVGLPYREPEHRR